MGEGVGKLNGKTTWFDGLGTIREMDLQKLQTGIS